MEYGKKLSRVKPTTPHSEEKDVLQAAEILVSMRNEILDVDTAKQLRIQREEFGEKRKRQDLLDRQETANCPLTLPQIPTIPGPIHHMIGDCSEPFLRKLTASDLDPGLHRLNLPTHKMRDLLRGELTRTEKESVNYSGLDVLTYDWKGNEYGMKLVAWAEGRFYALTSGWVSLCKQRKEMEAGDSIIVWMFQHRIKPRRCFALNLIKNE